MTELKDMTPEEALQKMPPDVFWQAWQDCPGGIAYFEMFEKELKRRIFAYQRMKDKAEEWVNCGSANPDIVRIVARNILAAMDAAREGKDGS